MFKKANIIKFLRLLVILLPVMFALASCSKDGAQSAEKDDTTQSSEMRSCWQDKVLTLLYDTMGKVAMGMYEKITDGAMSAVMVGFAIWFILRLLRFVGSVAEENSGQVWNDVLRKFFLCLFCGILASSTDGMLYTLNNFIFPIYNAFLELGGRILDGSVTDSVKSMGVLGETINVSKPVSCTASNYNSAATMEGFPQSSIKMMSCMICAVDERLSLGYEIVFKVVRKAGFLATINGLIIAGCFTIIKLAFVFYLVDNTFKFTVIVIMLPILIMAYPFKKQWTSYGFKIILSTSAFMMAIAIFIAMALMAIVEIIIQNQKIFNPDDPQAQVNDFSAVMMTLLLLAFLMVSTIKVAKEVTSGLVGGKIDSKFQEKLKGILQMAVGFFTGGLGSAVAKIGMIQRMKNRYENSMLGKAMQKKQELTNKVNKLAGRGK